MAVNVHEVCSEKLLHYILGKSDAKLLFFNVECNPNNNAKILIISGKTNVNSSCSSTLPSKS